MTNIIQTNPQYWTRRRMYAGPVAERLRELGFDLSLKSTLVSKLMRFA